MKTINWNQMSELNLIYRINKEILHPLGLAISREVETGFSKKILLDDTDREWEYASDVSTTILTKEEIWEKLEAMESLACHKWDEKK